MRDAIFGAIGSIAFNTSMRKTVGLRQHGIGQTAIDIMQNADFYQAGLAMIDRRKAMYGDQYGRDIARLAVCQDSGDSVAKRAIDSVDPLGPLGNRQIAVAGYVDDLRALGHGAGGFGWSIAVVDQARYEARHHRCFKFLCQLHGEGIGTRIPGGMAAKVRGINAKLLILLWNIMRGMFTQNHCRAISCPVDDLNALE